MFLHFYIAEKFVFNILFDLMSCLFQVMKMFLMVLVLINDDNPSQSALTTQILAP